jgi:hypothetical protein
MTSKRRPILLLSPPSEFYAYLLKGLAEGFKANGYRCNSLNVHVEQSELAVWARRSKACAVIEINRVLASDVDWPKDVAHVAWIQDYRAYGKLVTSDLGASDQLYFIVQPSVFGVDVPPGRSWSVLSPGVRTDVPPPDGATAQRDFCFAGFIPPPLDMQAQFSAMLDGRPVTLGEFLAQFPVDALQQSRTSLMISNRAIDDTCARIGCAPVTRQEIRRVFDEDLVRTVERKQVMEAILTVSKSLEIFGPPTWKKWPQFAPYYRGFVADPRELDPIFQTTRINLHNGVLTMHFRLLDCLAAGGFMMVNETDLDFLPGGIRTHFEPYRHYVPYPIDDAAAVAKAYLADAEARRRIAAQGRRAVLAAHTWTHRTAKILDDLNLPVLADSAERADAAA